MQIFRNDKLEAAINERQWSDEMVAAMAGVSKPIVIDLKKGRFQNKTIASIQKVATALGIPIRDLFDEQENAA